jgi:hypothetical protein
MVVSLTPTATDYSVAAKSFMILAGSFSWIPPFLKEADTADVSRLNVIVNDV